MTEGTVLLLSLKKNKFTLLLLSFVPYLFCAFFSQGFWHPDEHYQTLELINLKSGSYVDEGIFNWDFHESIRSWFQPALYNVILTPFREFLSPFSQATILRLFNGVLGWLSLVLFFRTVFSKEKFLKYLLISSYIWFVPYLFVRTSSESLSVSLFFIGASLFYRFSFLSGLIWGLSFLARYQMGIVLLCCNLYQLYIDKNLKRFIIHSLGILAALVIGVAIDYWGYGELVFSTVNYLVSNIIEGKASAFGTEPFWYYITKGVIKGIPPVSIILMIGAFKYFKSRKHDIWIVAFLSFFIIHSIIPHKEIRFLTLNYIFLIFFCLKAFDSSLFKVSKVFKRVLIFTVAINAVCLMKVSFLPSKSILSLYEFVYENDFKTIRVLSGEKGETFKFTMPFYQKREMLNMIW